MSYIIEDLKNNSTPLIEKAIEEIEQLEREKQASAMEYLALEGQCREHLDKIEAMRKDNEWIPVGERLPEPDTDVLCYLQFGSSHRITVAGLFPIEMGAGLRSGIRSEWLEFSNPDSALSNVTHWMPLPQPPAIKGEQA